MKRNVSDDDHLLVVLFESYCQDLMRILVHPLENLLIKLGNPPRGAQ
jgi:hypothetical protein